MNPNSEFDPVSVHIVLDKYISNSTKSGTRKMRSNDSSIRLFITGLGQFMPQTQNEWKGALSNNDQNETYFLYLQVTSVLVKPALNYRR